MPLTTVTTAAEMDSQPSLKRKLDHLGAGGDSLRVRGLDDG